MLDRFMRRLLDPALERAGRRLADRGVGADALTVAGLGIGLAVALCVALRLDLMALALFIANR
ncbi:MAG TPA: CDP-alcohol phosphatidyltransferase family protein, partial [Beijerinckiaceae bacterium]|nr:CDP-alcohol phosphatidyltransferase family protein [Beijerinckiaceae bacterium]